MLDCQILGRDVSFSVLHQGKSCASHMTPPPRPLALDRALEFCEDKLLDNNDYIHYSQQDLTNDSGTRELLVEIFEDYLANSRHLEVCLLNTSPQPSLTAQLTPRLCQPNAPTLFGPSRPNGAECTRGAGKASWTNLHDEPRRC